MDDFSAALEPSAFTEETPLSNPNSVPEKSLQRIFYHHLGPSYRPNVPPSPAEKTFPNTNEKTIRLEKLPVRSPTSVAHLPVTVKLRYQIHAPANLRVLAQASQMTVFDPSTTTPVAAAATDVTFELHDSSVRILNAVLDAIAAASGMGEALNGPSRRKRWMWALYAECGLLSERIEQYNWQWIATSMKEGGWWFRVYVVEVSPSDSGPWTYVSSFKVAG